MKPVGWKLGVHQYKKPKVNVNYKIVVSNGHGGKELKEVQGKILPFRFHDSFFAYGSKDYTVTELSTGLSISPSFADKQTVRTQKDYIEAVKRVLKEHEYDFEQLIDTTIKSHDAILNKELVMDLYHFKQDYPEI